MSGGSYNYICFKSATEIQELESMDALQAMADRLAELGYATDAALETQKLVLTIRQSQNRIWASQLRLKNLWQAVEWWDSGDSGEDGVKHQLELYRNQPTKS